MKRYLSIWLPHLSAERLLRRPPPELATKLAHNTKQNSLFAALYQDHRGLRLDGLNLHAHLAGLQTGMPVADARAAWPELLTWPGDRDADQAFLRQLARYCERYSPWPAPDIAPFQEASGQNSNPLRHGLMLDVSGVAHLFGGEDGLLQHIANDMQQLGLSRRLGLADTAGAAWAMARYGQAAITSNGQHHPWAISPSGPDGLRDSLAPLPVAALRLHGADVENLHRLGLRYIQDLYDKPRRSLTMRLGGQLLFRLDQALGHQGESLSPLPPPPENRVHMGFAEPIALPDDLHQACRELCDALCQLLEPRHMGIRQAVMGLERVDHHRLEHQIGVSFPSRDPDHLYHLFTGCFDQIDPGFGIESMDMTLVMGERLQAEQHHINLANGQNSMADASLLAPLFDRMTQRLQASGFQDSTVWRWHAGQDHQPEQMPVARPVFAPAPVMVKDMPLRPGHPRRPLRRLQPPEIIDPEINRLQHTAEDMVKNMDRESSSTMDLSPTIAHTGTPVPPTRFRWRRQQHYLRYYSGPERLRRNWWPGHDPDSRAWRDFYQVETGNGLRLWLSHDSDPNHPNDPGHWQVEGFFG